MNSGWHGQQEDRDHAVLAVLDNDAVFSEAALGGRDGVAQRWATTWRVGWFVLPFSVGLVQVTVGRSRKWTMLGSAAWELALLSKAFFF